MKNGKCKLCGKYEMREKEVGKFIMQDDIELPVFRHWKWCHLNNNWCRNIAGNCGEIVKTPEKKLEGETNEILQND